MEKLKECPFCLNKAEMHSYYDTSWPYSTDDKTSIPKTAKLVETAIKPDGKKCYRYKLKYYVPRCTITSCLGRIGKRFETAEEAAEKWNRRG